MAVSDQLESHCVPVSKDACRYCPDPCDEGHDEYPARFDIDTTSDMFGSVKPYHRQCVISTGKKDWVKEVTEEKGSLAERISNINSSLAPKVHPNNSKGDPSLPDGLFVPENSTRLAILNGSYNSVDDNGRQTVLVFPDYKFVLAENSVQDAHDLWLGHLGPDIGIAGQGRLEAYTIPYSAVILICSHKKRDNRCHVAAPKLEHSLRTALEHEGWEVHSQIDDHDGHGEPLNTTEGSQEQKDQLALERLKSLAGRDPKRALIIYNSHVGGHKFAGNLCIYTPTGSGVWYGRVTPHNVASIVKNTLVKGEVLPELLRGGINLSRKDGGSLLSW
ncbi:Sucraseferredoxin-like protein [Sistotremastrum niveocremeum HHB9708]|uniref:Sucraseferredoxin-like protein n=1 Tax=Sistotremastrum niveocremeum HHB9708 TaxID=1314777 RepID=A0A164ZJB3_9AGAM|nr:Sucraseferredoxin-like protein [Sistotremastrum niveocremeum HHB9708]